MVGAELSSLLKTGFLGLQIGMTFILIASGLTLVFGMLDVANLAHGSFVMLGGYLGLTIVGSGFGNYWLALIAVPVSLGIIAFGVERLTIRPVYDQGPLKLLLVTFGVALIIQEVVAIVWSSEPQGISAPDVLAGSIDLGLFTYPTFRFFIFCVSLIIVFAIWYALTRTDYGIILRASDYDPEMVQALGIDVWKVYTAVFVVSAMLAGLAGLLLGTVRAINPGMGLTIVIQAFAIIVIGGVGSFKGAVIGSLAIGLLNVFGALYYPSMTELIPFTLMAVVLLVKPDGLFGREVA